MAKAPKPDLPARTRQAAQTLAHLAAEAADADPALRDRLEAARRALEQPPAAAHAAILETVSDARALVRDVVAEELARYWDRRFGGKP